MEEVALQTIECKALETLPSDCAWRELLPLLCWVRFTLRWTSKGWFTRYNLSARSDGPFTGYDLSGWSFYQSQIGPSNRIVCQKRRKLDGMMRREKESFWCTVSVELTSILPFPFLGFAPERNASSISVSHIFGTIVTSANLRKGRILTALLLSLMCYMFCYVYTSMFALDVGVFCSAKWKKCLNSG